MKHQIRKKFLQYQTNTSKRSEVKKTIRKYIGDIYGTMSEYVQPLEKILEFLWMI